VFLPLTDAATASFPLSVLVSVMTGLFRFAAHVRFIAPLSLENSSFVFLPFSRVGRFGGLHPSGIPHIRSPLASGIFLLPPLCEPYCNRHCSEWKDSRM